MRTTVELVSKNIALITTTPAATMRAEVSLTGFGNLKRFVIGSAYRYTRLI
jgi:hypothetical protein